MVAAREGYEIQIVRADMTKPLPFHDGAFDLIFHPVSNCYVHEVLPIWRECYRVLVPGGILLAGLDNGLNFAFDEEHGCALRYTLPFDPLANEDQRRDLEEADDGMQFSHTIEEQIGGQLEPDSGLPMCMATQTVWDRFMSIMSPRFGPRVPSGLNGR